MWSSSGLTCRTVYPPRAVAADLSWGMTRVGHVLAVAVITVLAGVSGADVAHAGPPPLPPPCSFTLSPPHIVQLAGVDVVTATVAPDVCGPPATPAQSVACLQIQGDQPIRCYPSDSTGRAQVYSDPYVAGTTYVATGRGCGAWIGQPPAPDCQLLGPYSATL